MRGSYAVEAELKGLGDDERQAQRQELARPLWDKLKQWLELGRRLVADGAAATGAIDYTLGHWSALTRYLEDGAIAIDNNHLERQITPWAMGRRAWLFAGSELAGQRTAMVMSLVQSARLNGHDPWAYLRDVLARLPTHRNSRIEELLPHGWHRPRSSEQQDAGRPNAGRLTMQMVARATMEVALGHDGKVRLGDEVLLRNPTCSGRSSCWHAW